MSIDTSKLPAYAQRYIANLEEENALLKAALGEEEPTRIHYSPTVRTKKYIPENASLMVGDFYIQIDEHDGGIIVTHRSGPVGVYPSATNRFAVTPKKQY